jgi:hypothetical protein
MQRGARIDQTIARFVIDGNQLVPVGHEGAYL